tara:strand:- start:20916 stop:21329 length:414 start_codon:yes stop_codon:yes gene_type:complete
MSKESDLKISRLAELSGVGIETIRFYERKGLIAQPIKENGSFRKYPLGYISNIKFIKKAQNLGFSLKEIKELLEIHDQTYSKCKTVKQKALKKLESINRKISELQEIKMDLQSLINSCDEDASLENCSILNSLTGDQ